MVAEASSAAIFCLPVVEGCFPTSDCFMGFGRSGGYKLHLADLHIVVGTEHLMAA
jgi:hypothetical protein